MKKSYIASLISFGVSVTAFIAFNIAGSNITHNGILQEPFWLIGVGAVFGLASVIFLLCGLLRKKIFIAFLVCFICFGGIFIVKDIRAKHLCSAEGNTWNYAKASCDVSVSNIVKNASFLLEGSNVQLTDGISAVPIENSSLVNLTKYYGCPSSGQLEDKKTAALSFVISNESGGSGTFYYLAAAVEKDGGYIIIDPVFIGDRIKPIETSINNGILIISYLDRAAGEGYSAEPSIQKNRKFKVADGIIIEI